MNFEGRQTQSLMNIALSPLQWYIFTPFLSLMLISAPLVTRYPKICSQRPFLAAMWRGVNWWRKMNYKGNWQTTWQVSVHAYFYNLWFLDYLCTDGECRTLSWVLGNVVNSKLKPVISHCNLVPVSSLTYLIIVFAVGIGSTINKEFHCAHLELFNCNVQGSSLTERLEQSLRE